jgi:hypothetical protein
MNPLRSADFRHSRRFPDLHEINSRQISDAIRCAVSQEARLNGNGLFLQARRRLADEENEMADNTAATPKACAIYAPKEPARSRWRCTISMPTVAYPVLRSDRI